MDTVDLALARPGRRSEPPTAKIVRDLTEADLAARRLVPAQQPQPLQRLRDSHHHLAKTLASGAEDSEAALLTGYSISRISILKADPAFKELLEFYRKKNTGLYETVQDRFSSFMLDNLTILQDKIDEGREVVTSDEARANIKMASTIAGYGPVNKSLNVNMNIDYASRLAEARKRSSMAPSDARLIEGAALPSTVDAHAEGEVSGKASPSVGDEE